MRADTQPQRNELKAQGRELKAQSKLLRVQRGDVQRLDESLGGLVDRLKKFREERQPRARRLHGIYRLAL